MPNRSHLRFVARGLLGMMLVAVALLVAAPSVAYARDYSIDQVTIDATVDQSGSLAVKETRQFDFDGEYHGVYWKLPKGSYEGRTVEPTIGSVGEMRNGSFAAFAESDSETDGTYQLTDYGSYVQVKIFSTHEDEQADFVINFTYANIVNRWQDTAELYWKFVSDGWDEPSDNVVCTIHLPVPAGASVLPERNVRAWGHGPLDASVAFDGNDVVYTVPGVGTREFAEARITFPEEWVPGAEQMAGSKMDGILAEEQQWVDEANAQRARARVIMGVIYVVMGVSAAGTLAIALLQRVRYRKSHTPQFDDEYYRDVPSNDHPAVLGTLYRGSEPNQDDFTASLMRLADMGHIQLDLVKYKRKGAFGRMKEKEDYRLLQVDRVEGGLRGDATLASCDRIDRAAMKFLFQTVSGHHDMDESLRGPHGEDYVLTSYFEEVARRHPQSYENGYDGWKNAVTGAMETRGFTRDDGKTGQAMCIALGVFAIIVGVSVGIFAWVAFDAPVLVTLPLLLLDVAAGVASIVMGSKLVARSSEAVELTAKLGALRRWLKDFTRLDEAIPTDVVLWNRLLVMATALGVADDVIRQLKVAMPRLLEDPYFYSYGWYYYGGRAIGHPAGVVGSSFGQAHSVSAAKLASSSDSSGGGGGGGFSGGGGGGFGGGGGGGAF